MRLPKTWIVVTGLALFAAPVKAVMATQSTAKRRTSTIMARMMDITDPTGDPCKGTPTP